MRLAIELAVCRDGLRILREIPQREGAVGADFRRAEAWSCCAPSAAVAVMMAKTVYLSLMVIT